MQTALIGGQRGERRFGRVDQAAQHAGGYGFAAVASDAAGGSGSHRRTASLHEAGGGTESTVGGESPVALAMLVDEVIAEAAGPQGPIPAGFAVLDGDPVLSGGGAEQMFPAH